jgi:hypothetical protein
MSWVKSSVEASKLTGFISSLGFDPKQTVDIRLQPGRWDVTLFVCDRDGQFLVVDGEPLTVTVEGRWDRVGAKP